MSQTYFLGIDVSTTGSKALLVDENGVVVGHGVCAAHAADAQTALVGAGPARMVAGERQRQCARCCSRPG